MRPVRLTIEGLACFKDKQEIDFAALDLFAISGPTGAGKSTLLDAMIFALYGEVPRVDSHSRSEMISAARDRVSVLLDFDVGAVRYRIARTLRRSGVHSVRFERHDGQDFSVNLADKVGTVGEKVTEVLGVDATAFMQAVVLPQGEFAKFLKAQPRDRRNMLRSLLRLDVYERMRERAQHLATTMKSTVESLTRVLAEEYGGVHESALADLDERHLRVVAELEELRKRRGEAQTGLDRLRGQHARTIELNQRETQWLEIQTHTAEVDALRAQIEAADRAAPLLLLLEEAGRAAGGAASASMEAAAAAAELRMAQAESGELSTALAATQRAAEAILDLHAQIARLNQVVGRLPEVAHLEEVIARRTTDIETRVQDLAALNSALEAAQVAQRQQQAAVDAAGQALQDSNYDAALDALLETLRNRAVELGTSRRGAVEAGGELEVKGRDLAALQAGVEPLAAEAQIAANAAHKARQLVQAAEETLHRAHHLDAANNLRGTLQPGQPCPVCEQAVASPPPPNLNPEVDAAVRVLEAAKAGQQEAEALFRDSEGALTRAQTSAALVDEHLADLKGRFALLGAAVVVADAELRAALGTYGPGVNVVVETWVAAEAAKLADTRRAHDQAKEQLANAERALEKAKSDEAGAQERISEKEASRQRLEQDREVSGQRLSTLRAEIAAVTRSQDPAAEAGGLAERIEQLENDLRTAVAAAATAQNRLTTARETSRLTTDAAEKAREEAADRTGRRDEGVARAGFEDEAAVRAALLEDTARPALSEAIRKHELDLHALGERIAALRQELGELRVSDEDLAAAEHLATDLATGVETQHGAQKTIEEQIGRMKERLGRSQTLQEQLGAEEQALRVYSQLAGDLRSDKFQAYVLEEAFTELVKGASARLLSLTGERYSLLFRQSDILVVDNDNAGETRISDTLSGGETFLTSLSLALELSDQVQRAAGAVNLDSLFIDEGFGTLDPDTLALVSETIQGLGVGGRMVGIITHIPELRDEFAQQIIVTKHQGFSTVEVRGGAHHA